MTATPPPAASVVPRIVAVDWDDERAVSLREAMDAEMSVIYGEDGGDDLPPGFSVSPEEVERTWLSLDPAGAPVGHLAMRRLDGELELKRLIVLERARGGGHARALMATAEEHARSLGAPRLVLHTGDRQPAAIALYEATGWVRVPVFEPYTALDVSVCFAKDLASPTSGPLGDPDSPSNPR